MTAALLGLALGVSLAAWLGTGWLRRYALARSLVDVPNARSSHSTPTPRGGGLAVVLPFLVVILLLGWVGLLPAAEVAALLGAATLVAAVGFLDDHGHVAARWRLLTHFVAAAWLLGCAGIPAFSSFGLSAVPIQMLAVVAALYVVWVLNLYNFMDGIDGIAAVEGIAVATGGAVLAIAAGHPVEVIVPPLMLAAALGGFLAWNFPPARIFMGDVGSGFVGAMLAAFSLQAGRHDEVLFWSWLILLGVFVVDATFTLLRRLLRGERVYQAHRSHGYQQAARRWKAHRPVTLAVVMIDVFWLLPIAALVILDWMPPLHGLAVAYAPLLVGALLLGAGRREPTVGPSL
ncbi:MraY family glycosyltransferase [Azoarcus olearius]|uniref:Membrane protein involved in cell envelope biogenesis n=1 Tax=Azoarcus sp. (strain BH72) TaxID=418699 RepID=A1KBJ2_AZOSB|nr:glycosyltransferase family 4 protein [Azoarcus olearius]CAL96198.1 membrane protein involved in cell envelope biogenesis [Azoarcus olearius]